ncbi:MAG: ATP-binding protein [Prolixibacteraceae bacterium]|jgi:predicted AAA+ superfamily ATPase|nr:ATP-binding protein [Prolixibacteraceae bacterium]
MIERLLKKIIEEKIGKKKAIILLGARQTGKTTLVKKIQNNLSGQTLFLNADDPVVRQQFSEVSLENIKPVIGKAVNLIIDEAQRIRDIGITLKLIVDEMPDVQLIVTGSSSLELANIINEPLTGRKYEYWLYPISWQELVAHTNYVEALSQLEQRIVFGMYPDVIVQKGEEKETLINLTESYLYKDIIAFQQIRKPEFVHKLLQALAFQTGNEVSYNELSNLLQIDRKTVINYIDLLEKAFIIFRLPSFSRNLRNELSSKIKIYFYDTGIRNTLIGDFRPLNLRQDKGALWENFLVSERIKSNHYSRKYVNMYFWKTHQKQEIDLIEEADGQLCAFEFKWSKETNARIPGTFLNTYKNATTEIVTSANFNKFLTHE